MFSSKQEFTDKATVEVLFFPKLVGHIAVKIHDQVQGSEGYYLSHGGAPNANDNFTHGASEDEKHYKVEPIRIWLKLSKKMTPEMLSARIKEFKSDPSLKRDHNYTSNNCADQVLRLLKETLGYVFFEETKIDTITTPVFVATQACQLALEQNAQTKQITLTEAPSLNNLFTLIACEINRLNIEMKLAKIATTSADWKSLKVPIKLWDKMKEGYDIRTKKDKIMQLSVIYNLIRTMENPSPEKYQHLLNELNECQKKIGGKTASAVQVCLEHFPFAELPNADEKRVFLAALQEELKRDESVFKKQTFWQNTLPPGIIEIKEKLKGLDENQDQNAFVQKIFFEVQQLLQKNISQKSENSFMLKFYMDWNGKANQAQGEINIENSFTNQARRGSYPSEGGPDENDENDETSQFRNH